MGISAFWTTLSSGIKSLFLHKLRSALTVLGILIGVTAVIWLVAMGEGVSLQAQEQIKNLGATSIILRTNKPTEETASKVSRGFGVLAYGLLREDYQRIRANVANIVEAVPMREMRRDARHNDRNVEARIVGCTPPYLEMNRLSILRGRFLTDNDSKNNANVCVLAAETAKKLFPYEDPLGQSVRVDNEFYVVVGQTNHREESAGIGGSLAAQDYNLDVYIPLEAFRWRFGDMIFTSKTGSFEGEVVQLSQITLKVATLEQVDNAAKDIEELLRLNHPTKDYVVVVPKELLRQAETLQMMFNVLLVLIAGISLLVGGIGIMNIMLATVTERTREIGIRRALGAKQSHILWQFLTETSVLTFTGGLLGVVLGLFCKPVVIQLRYLISRWDAQFFASLPDSIRNLEPRIAPWSIVVSLLIAVLVGVFFGLYPAQRAARMDPIEALRHE